MKENTYIITSEYLSNGIFADKELIRLWKNELKDLQEKNADSEKIERLRNYIIKAEKTVLLMSKAEKILSDLTRLEG